MHNNRIGMLAIVSFVLLAAIGAPHRAIARAANALYTTRAPLDEYLMPDRAAEIALARSAAPPSISRDATILVLGPRGYETAVRGKNGFACMVGRGWGAAFDWSEFWNPKIRAAECLNPEAARSMLPIDELRARMVMAGRSKQEMESALKAAFENHRLPKLENGAMSYMMSKSAYLTDQGTHTLPHVMFNTQVKNGEDWGSGAADSPVMSSPYWFFSPKDASRDKGFPRILVFLVAVPKWSDGTPASQHEPMN